MSGGTASTSKVQRLDRLHSDFLFELAKELNGNSMGSYRNYSGHERDELIDLLAGKLSSDDTEVILSKYLLCKSPSEVAEAVKPASVDDIRDVVERFFGQSGLSEVKIGRRTCDLVFPDDLIAVEIKSARDKVEEAIKQLEHHRDWAEKIYLAYDETHHSSIPEDFDEIGAGLLRYGEGRVEEVKKPGLVEHSSEEYLSMMVYSHLERIAESRNIASSGSKEELVSRLVGKIDQEEARHLFKTYLATRS